MQRKCSKPRIFCVQYKVIHKFIYKYSAGVIVHLALISSGVFALQSAMQGGSADLFVWL